MLILFYIIGVFRMNQRKSKVKRSDKQNFICSFVLKQIESNNNFFALKSWLYTCLFL